MSDAQELRFFAVAKSFGASRPVLRDLTAAVPLRGVTFVVGQSGSGKSVLCRLAVGLLRPDAGGVELFGERVDLLPERQLHRLRARAPYLVQGPALLNWLSVEENVALANHGKDPAAVASALARVGLTEVAGRSPTALGPGTQKRAAIARALVLRPRYLLLDEPTTGLDRAAARQVNEVILSLKREGLGALVVSHDYRSLAEVADRVLVVADGRSAFLGTTAKFLSSTDPAVRALA